MALELMHLRKLLKLMLLDARHLRSALLADIREDRAREAGEDSSGGDFYAPFWADARQHVFGSADLHQSVEERIASNDRRRHLYPRLRDGFLLWWNRRRRWTNEPFHPGQPINARFPFPGIDAVVKVDSIMSVQDGVGAERLIYPYFSPEPEISEHAARLGLWLLATALPRVSPDAIRILDVIRGRTFSLDRTPLIGNEESDFYQRYMALLRLRNELRDEAE